MANLNDVIMNLSYFCIFVIALIIVFAIVFHFYLKKYEFNLKKSKIYGILNGLDNKSIIALSLFTINYLFLTWSAMMTTGINWIYASMIILLPFVASILIKDYIKAPLGVIISLINCFALYILNFVHLYLVDEVSDIFMRISIFLIVAFIFIYFTYNFINDINDVISKNKFIMKKKKKVGVK